MGTTLTGTTPQDTYEALIKVGDNGIITGSLKTLSDGEGNDSALALSDSAASVTGTLAVSGNVAIGATLSSWASGFRAIQMTQGSALISHPSVPITYLGANYLTADTGSKYIVNGFSSRFLLDGNSGGMTFNVAPSGTAGGDITYATAMQITAAGNVGIGTDAPTAKLDVVGTSSSEFGALRLFNSRQSGAEQQSVSILMRTANTVGNFPSVKLIAQESTSDSNLGQFIVQASNDNSANLAEIFRTAPAGAGGAPFLRMAASTGGIQFNGDTAAANALDDYEEGTWTMGVSFGGGSVDVTFGANAGTYTKIGRQVTVNGRVTLTSKGSSSGAAAITGLPFTIGAADGNFASASLWVNQVSFANQFQAFAAINSTNITLWEVTEAGAPSTLDDPNFTNGSDIMVNLTYFV